MKGKKGPREDAKRTPVDMMVDDPKMQAKILKQFEKQKVLHYKIFKWSEVASSRRTL